MPEALKLLEIGALVSVDLQRIKDRLPSFLLRKLTSDSQGKVVNYKMTDGGGIGFILEFRDGLKIWVFKEELEFIKDKNPITSDNFNELTPSLIQENLSVNNSADHELPNWLRETNNSEPIDIYYLLNQ